MSSVETPLIHLLSRALELTVQRQGVVSQNIANIDTPGYHTRDIDFHAELERAITSESSDPVGSPPFVQEVRGLIERPDGNNVNIDQEASNLMLYQQAYQASAEVISTVNQMLQTILNM